MMTERSSHPPFGGLRALGLGKAYFTIVGCLVFAVLAPITLGQVRDVAERDNLAIPTYLVWFVRIPWLISVLCLPAIVTAVIAIRDRRRMWLWLAVSTLFLLLILTVVATALVTMLRPLYDFQPL